MKSQRIAIIGASIAGGAIANLLLRKGFIVSIFEKTAHNAMADRGAGIALPVETVDRFLALDLFDKDYPRYYLAERLFLTKTNDMTDIGRELTRRPFPVCIQHWASIYLNLAKRIPSEAIHYGMSVSDISRNKNAVILNVNGDQQQFDYVIAADGYSSLARRTLFPESTLKFTNCIAWRGVLENPTQAQIDTLKANAQFCFHEKGHSLCSLLPHYGSNQQGDGHCINWLLYEVLHDEHPIVKANLVGKNIAVSNMPTELIEYLHAVSEQAAPNFLNNVIQKTPHPFLQSIYECDVPALYQDRIALMGDSGFVIRPHTASGSTKALQNALALSDALDREDSFESAFQAWNQERHAHSLNIFHLGQALGKFFVTDLPDLANISHEDYDTAWQSVIDGRSWYAGG